MTHPISPHLSGSSVLTPYSPANTGTPPAALQRTPLESESYGGGIHPQLHPGAGKGPWNSLYERLPDEEATVLLSDAGYARELAEREAPSPVYHALSSLPPQIQREILDYYDPVIGLKLTDDTVFYRRTKRKHIQSDADNVSVIHGNPDSIATIINYTLLDKRTDTSDDDAAAYDAVKTRASALPDPSFNVTYGQGGLRAAHGYQSKKDLQLDEVIIEMTLGDLRKAGGGQVFDDDSAVVNNALIVTLPEGRAVPVRVIELAEADAMLEAKEKAGQQARKA
jgi:AvrPphF-ORF-2